ncbi:hypothetical protein ACFSVJ_02250 [Prauserella oleivorans]
MITPADDLIVVSPLMLEVGSVRRGLGRGCVVRAGPHARRAKRVAAALRQQPGRPVAVAGVAGALVDELKPGDVVVASEVRSAQGTHHCRSAPLLATCLRSLGLTVHVGPMVETDHVVWQPEGHDSRSTAPSRWTWSRRACWT